MGTYIDYLHKEYGKFYDYSNEFEGMKPNKKIEAWNQALNYQKNKAKDCKFCGKSGLKWSPEDHAQTGKWRLFEGKLVHKCIREPKAPAPMTEKEIKTAESQGKKVYQLRPRLPKPNDQ